MLWVEEDTSLKLATSRLVTKMLVTTTFVVSTSMKPFEECDTFIKRLYIRDRRSAFYITIEILENIFANVAPMVCRNSLTRLNKLTIQKYFGLSLTTIHSF